MDGDAILVGFVGGIDLSWWFIEIEWLWACRLVMDHLIITLCEF
jgi:hypothetical protein